jgi:hypothetical protein
MTQESQEAKPPPKDTAPPMKRTAWVRYATPLGSTEVTGARMVPVSLAAEPWPVECGNAP